LFQTVARYIKGHIKDSASEGGDPKPKKIKPVYTIRDVIKQNYRGLVEAEICYKPTDKEYIGNYQRAVSTVLENMTKKDLKEANDVVELWNSKGAPQEVQLKWVLATSAFQFCCF
jgi:hypothetical protein